MSLCLWSYMILSDMEASSLQIKGKNRTTKIVQSLGRVYNILDSYPIKPT